MDDEMKRDTNADFYLYAKGWYESKDMIVDLRTIASKIYMIPFESTTVSDVVNILLTIIGKEMATPEKFYGFMESISPDNWKLKFFGVTDYSFNDSVIRACMSIMSIAKVVDIKDDGTETTILNLGEPNPDILPLAKKSV